MKKFAQLLGTFVETSGMKQTRIASSAGISYNYLQRLLSGDRNPSDQVVSKLAEALHLSAEQTGALLAAAGYAPPVALLQSAQMQKQAGDGNAASLIEPGQVSLLAQQLYHLAPQIPEPLQTAFFEEIKHFLGYARYKYVLSGGANLLELDHHLSQFSLTSSASATTGSGQPYLDVIAQLVGELSTEPDKEDMYQAEELAQPPAAVEDMLSAIDRLTGNILAGEISAGNYQPRFILEAFDMLREGAPWEIRRRIAEALPGLCQLDITGAERLMEALRLDVDDIRGADIRRRVVEALPALFDVSPLSLAEIIRLLRPRSGDDIYTALATLEVCGDIQAKIKHLLEGNLDASSQSEQSRVEMLAPVLQPNVLEIARIQRQLLVDWEGTERECLQFSLALHHLLCAPDTLLLSLREGLQSAEQLIQLVAARYLERLLPSRPLETLELYKVLLHSTARRNVRRAVARALPALLQCLKEASLSIRAHARLVISDLAVDPDIYIRRAVADHAMQIFHIDREFLLILLRQMHKDTDQAIRHRLQPVALLLAQVWLVWYAETAGFIDAKRSRHKTATPFGE